MQNHHWFLLIIVGLVFYYVGAKYPALVTKMGL